MMKLMSQLGKSEVKSKLTLTASYILLTLIDEMPFDSAMRNTHKNRDIFLRSSLLCKFFG